MKTFIKEFLEIIAFAFSLGTIVCLIILIRMTL
jgi:hypothetical protein